MITTVSATCPAKINLHLAVGQLEANGYHSLTTIYQAIDITDTVTLTSAPQMSIASATTADIGPLDHTNLAWKALVSLADYMDIPNPTYEIIIDKHIPITAGLAGGSADAAATLKAAAKLWSAPAEAVESVAATLGSDVPFLLHGGCALGTGHGEIVTPILTRGEYYWVVVSLYNQLSTPLVYAELDRIRQERLLPNSAKSGSPQALLSALMTGEAASVAPFLSNDLQAAAISLLPQIRKVLHAGVQAGALNSLVSGSGPTCLFLAEDAGHATTVAADIARKTQVQSIKVACGPTHGAHVV